jgi:tRNA G10  N-methylase Trm11
MKLVVTYVNGLEDIVLEKIKEKGIVDNLKLYKGFMIFDFKGNIELLIKLKNSEDIMFLVKRFTSITRYKSSLRNIRHQSAKMNIKKFLKPIEKIRHISENVFSVKASYQGRRDYKASDIEKAVTSGIKKHYNWKTGSEPELLLNVLITEKIAVCGLSLQKCPIHVINSVKYTVPGSIKSSLANCLLDLSRLEKEDLFLDPMAGSGIIAIEASLRGANAIAGDVNEKILKKAKQNSDLKKANVEFHLWDARDTGLPENYVDKIASNLPFGKQVEIKKEFFLEFIKEITRITKNNARIVFLTKHAKFIEEIIKDNPYLRTEKKIKIINSGLESFILIIIKSPVIEKV